MRVWNKVRSLFGRSIESDLAEEMRLHRTMLEERFRAEGMSLRQARERAAREFGPAARALEDSRAEWSFAWLESIWTDVWYAVRALRRSKIFAATAVLTLGVGLGLALVAFALFNAYVLRPFAVSDPDGLYSVTWRGKDRRVEMHPRLEFDQIRSRTDIFSGVFAARGVSVMGETRQWFGVLVTGNYFRVLGARIGLGRPIEEEDARTPGGDTVVVLSHAAWRAAFNLDPAVLGKKIMLRGRPFEVIGVTSQEFAGLGEAPPDFWTPLSMHAAFHTEDVRLEVVGRLRPGVNRAQAEAALGVLAQRDREDMRAFLDPRATVVAFTPFMILVFSPVLLALGLVLATCCANVANMMLARGLARQREIGVRLSVGAGRARLVRQLLTEALAIAGLAGLLGVLLARVVLDGSQRIFFATIPPEFAKLVRLHSLEIDYRVFLFALGAATVAAMGAALLPALQSTRMDLVAALRGEFGGGVRSSRLRDGLVVAQVVVCVVLLVCGALLYRRGAIFEARDPGMRKHGVVDINLSDRLPEVAEFLRSAPEVEAIAVAQRAPFYGRLDRTMVTPSGHASSTITEFNLVSPEYFQVFGISLRRGRSFTVEEARAEAPVAIVSAAAARAFWPGQDPIGKTLSAGQSTERHLINLPTGYSQIQVVGVSPDTIDGAVFADQSRTCIYLPTSREGKGAKNLLVLVRGDETRALDKLRRLIIGRWPKLDADIVPMSAVLALRIYPFKAAAWIGWILGLVAMALSVSGMYGVMSYLVNQRSKEIGIRVALGATATGVVTLVMRRSVWLSGLGVAIGGGTAAGAVKLLLWWSAGASVSLLAWDSTALLTGVGLAGCAAVLAALGPSSRAARVDPNIVLRTD